MMRIYSPATQSFSQLPLTGPSIILPYASAITIEASWKNDYVTLYVSEIFRPSVLFVS
jgi:hypothetical protein